MVATCVAHSITQRSCLQVLIPAGLCMQQFCAQLMFTIETVMFFLPPCAFGNSHGHLRVKKLKKYYRYVWQRSKTFGVTEKVYFGVRM